MIHRLRRGAAVIVCETRPNPHGPGYELAVTYEDREVIVERFTDRTALLARAHELMQVWGFEGWSAERAPAVNASDISAMLNEFIGLHRENIIKRSQAKVAVRAMPRPTEAEITHGIPLFLDQLLEALRSRTSGRPNMDRGAGQHESAPMLHGLAVSQVVHDYEDIFRAVTELAIEMNAPISNDDFRTLNQCLHGAIASAVTIHAHESPQAVTDAAVDREHERLAFLIHELRNLVTTAAISFEGLKSGNVGVTGTAGAVLERSLRDLRELVARSLDDVRSRMAIKDRRPVLVATFIEEVAASAMMEARVRGIQLAVPVSVDEDVTIEVDRHVLAGVVRNLFQNAFKFTRPGTTVTLQVSVTAARVLIEVQDECGGLPGVGEAMEIGASFEQRQSDRTGLGMGLAFSRWGAEANGGRLYARNMPGTGCVFTVSLPRSMPSAALFNRRGPHHDAEDMVGGDRGSEIER